VKIVQRTIFSNEHAIIPATIFGIIAYQSKRRVEDARFLLVRLWHADERKPGVRAQKVIGVGTDVLPATAAWKVKAI